MLNQGHTVIASFPRRVWGSAGALCLLAAVHADTPYLGNNAILSQATRATVAANGDNHAIATAQDGAVSAVLDWTKFNVGSGQTMTFDGSKTTFFNLVDGSAGKSEINGLIKGSAGGVWVINPAGIAFGASAQVYLDGLFAAAAGNVSNADALRAGTAMLPEFSSFDGKVEVNGSPLFTSDKGAPVALLGKTISVNGGKFSWDCTFAAGNQIVVDNVGGGKVSLTVSDFIADPSVNTVDLGDLQVGGNVTSRSGGNTTLGNVRSTRGNVDVGTLSGDILVNSGADVQTKSTGSGVGNITLKSAINGEAQGDVFVKGTVRAANDVRLTAGAGQDASGNAVVDGNISGRAVTIEVRDGTVATGVGSEVKGTSSVSFYANKGGTGSITASGKIKGGNVLLASPDGITLKNSDNENPAEILAQDGNIGIYTASGDISIESGTTIRTMTERDDVGEITLISATHDNKQGNIIVEGSVNAANDLLVLAGGVPSAAGNVTVGGSLSGKEAVVAARGSGGVSLKGKGTVSGRSGVTVMAGGSVDMDADTRVTVSDGGASIHSAVRDGEGDAAEHRGDITVRGEVRAETETLLVSGSGGQKCSGDVIVEGSVRSGNVLFRAQNGSVLSQNGSWTSGRKTEITATMGNVDLEADGCVEIGGGVEIHAQEGSVYLESATADNATGDVTVDGSVRAAEALEVFSGTFASASGNVHVGGTLNGKEVRIRARDGSVTSCGDIVGDSFVRIYATRGTTGDITLSGKTTGGSVYCQSLHDISVQPSGDGTPSSVTATGEAVFFYTADGNVEIGKGTTVQALRGDVSFATANGAEGRGDIAVNGDVRAAKSFRINAGCKSQGDGNIVVNGCVDAQEAVYLIAGIHEDAGVWNVKVTGDVTVESGPLYIVTGYGKQSAGGDVGITGTLSTGSNTGGDPTILLRAYNHGNISVHEDATIKALGDNGAIELVNAIRSGATGDVKIDGDVFANGKNGMIRIIAGYGPQSRANLVIGGNVFARGTGGNVMASASYGEGSHGDLKVLGSVTGNDAVILRTGYSNVGKAVTSLTGSGDVAIKGDVTTIAENGEATVWSHFGGVSFGAGHVISPGKVVLVAGKDVTHAGTFVEIKEGVANSISLPAAISGKAIDFVVHGDLGEGVSRPVAVDGKVFGRVDGDASIAAARAGDFRGGEGRGRPSIDDVMMIGHLVREKAYDFNETKETRTATRFKKARKYTDELGNEQELIIPELLYSVKKEGHLDSVTMDGFEITALQIDGIDDDFGRMGSTSTLSVGGALSVYTSGAIESKGILAAEGDLTVTAKSFGDVSYLRAGGTLTINNVGHPKHPRVAYFESLDGREPRINNLPNDMVIFVDGRLAGGNVNIMNMFGANEAFLVSTPELKSTQGIFGDPPFLHSDLDVANPMEVSAIDYLIQEVPRLTLSSEFPADVDQKVEANGLSLKDSYWFGQRRVAVRVEDAADGKVASGEEQ